MTRPEKDSRGVHYRMDSDRMRRRASGEAPEMNQALQCARILEGRVRRGSSFLDVGCGSGHFLRTIRTRIDDQARYFGVDRAPDYLKIGAEYFGNRFVLADIHDIGKLFRRRFDVVLCYMVLEHLPDYSAALKALAEATGTHLVVRLLLGHGTHYIKKHEWPDEPDAFQWYNVYDEKKFLDDLRTLGFSRAVAYPDDFRLDLPYSGPNSTWTSGDLQILGNVLLTWRTVLATR